MTIEKLQAQVAELQAQVAALSVQALADTPGLDGYYASRYSGEQIDNLLSGLGFEIGGSYANLAAIQAAFPNGDTHAYQARDTMDIYVWNTNTRAWESVGKLQGPVGPKGDKGDHGGPPGPQGERGPGSNPNLLDNWYFANPINQRGQQEYNTGGYSIDRWKLVGNTGIKLQIQDDGLVITSPSQFECYFTQVLDQNIVSFLRGKTVTISKLTTENSGLFSIMMYSNDIWLGGTSNEEGLVAATIQIPEDAQKLIFQFGANGMGTTKIEAVKLELGTEQTLARQDANDNWVLNDPPPNYALELAKCQRYQVVFGKKIYALIGEAKSFGDPNQLELFFNLPIPMRASPTVSFVGNFRFCSEAGIAVVSASSNVYPISLMQNSMTFGISRPSGLTGESFFVDTNDVDSYAILDANL